jgi:predicted enzyme related to lactoylglutathione lyase
MAATEITERGVTMTGSSTQGIKTVLYPVSDLAAAEVTAAGATLKDPARDVGGGRRVATISDPDGNVLGLIQDR